VVELPLDRARNASAASPMGRYIDWHCDYNKMVRLLMFVILELLVVSANYRNSNGVGFLFGAIKTSLRFDEKGWALSFKSMATSWRIDN
jgi:hypothetical protein